MLRFTAVAVVVYLVGALVSRFSPGSVFGILEAFGLAGLAVALAYYAFLSLRAVKRRLFWKVRNKIIISYAFVGILPIAILIFLSWFSFTLIFRQLSAIYLENELQNLTATMRHINEQILLEYFREPGLPEGRFEQLFENSRNTLAIAFPGLESVHFLLLGEAPGRGAPPVPVASAVPWGTPTNPPESMPDWLRGGFSGPVLKDHRVYYCSVVPFQIRGRNHWLVSRLPFDESFLEHLQGRTSIHLQPFSVSSDGSEVGTGFRDFFTSEDGLFQIRWIHFLRPVDWESGKPVQDAFRGVLLAVPWRTLYDRLFEFTETTDIGKLLIGIIITLGIVFVLVEGISLLIGIAIARSITASISDIHRGTRHIREGDFDFRIPSGNRDQLDDMANGFNQMAEHIVTLMNQVSEKERLEKEIEIAREVQTRLFPQTRPRIRNLQLSGSCYPARQVSGDYYDFIPYGPHRLDVIIADISGKGISAALLMASLQSTVRTLVFHEHQVQAVETSIAGAVSEINRQLFHQTASDKFATLVLSRFDTERMTLTYCNAGHNPPFLVSNGDATFLRTGGTVVGLFEDWHYEEETVRLQQGDLLVFYTDGVVEAENGFEEQFGEERLIRLAVENAFLTAEDVRSLVFEELSRWGARGEQLDDMTMVVLKVE